MSDDFRFKTTNAAGGPLRCKFCGGPVWWSVLHRRWYEPGGERLHVKSCASSAEHARQSGLDAAEARRQRRSR